MRRLWLWPNTWPNWFRLLVVIVLLAEMGYDFGLGPAVLGTVLFLAGFDLRGRLVNRIDRPVWAADLLRRQHEPPEQVGK